MSPEMVTGELRRTIARLAEGNAFVTYGLVFAALGVEDSQLKDKVRRAMCKLAESGELRRMEPGVYTYHPHNGPERTTQNLDRVYKGVRCLLPGWTIAGLCQRSMVSDTTARKYVSFLVDEGFVEVLKEKAAGSANRYRATLKAQNQPQPPMPPLGFKDPYEREKSATCQIVRLMLANLDKAANRQRIADNAQVLVDRFKTAECDTVSGAISPNANCDIVSGAKNQSKEAGA